MINDIDTRIVTYLSGQITKRILLKTLFDISEMLYYDEKRKFIVWWRVCDRRRDRKDRELLTLDTAHRC
jgi:hypothetical protein